MTPRQIVRATRRSVCRCLPESLVRMLCGLRKLARRTGHCFFPPGIGKLSYVERVRYLRRIDKISQAVHCAHKESQICYFVDAFLSLPATLEGCIVEAGCYKGGSAAKFSIAAQWAGRELVLFDSFQGLPDNREQHEESILGHSIRGWFVGGSFCGTLEDVKNTIRRFGRIENCRFIQGWFEDTMPSFSEKICAIYLDVDLASSTRTCIKHLYPLLVPGGVLVSQDGDFPLIIELLGDDAFWESEVGCKKPFIEGLGADKMIKIVKPTEMPAQGRAPAGNRAAAA